MNIAGQQESTLQRSSNIIEWWGHPLNANIERSMDKRWEAMSITQNRFSVLGGVARRGWGGEDLTCLFLI